MPTHAKEEQVDGGVGLAREVALDAEAQVVQYVSGWIGTERFQLAQVDLAGIAAPRRCGERDVRLDREADVAPYFGERKSEYFHLPLQSSGDPAIQAKRWVGRGSCVE